jgi:hypothetical protein
MTTATGYDPGAAASRFPLADAFLKALAAQDFTQLGGALSADARLRALVPRGLIERTGAEEIAGTFARWFGDTEGFDPVAVTVSEVGGRLHLAWRLRLQATRLGAGWFTVEQQAYADTGDHGRIDRLDLLCTGYRPEGADG